jgi:hypothetical protein
LIEEKVAHREKHVLYNVVCQSQLKGEDQADPRQKRVKTKAPTKRSIFYTILYVDLSCSMKIKICRYKMNNMCYLCVMMVYAVDIAGTQKNGVSKVSRQFSYFHVTVCDDKCQC